MRSMSSAENPCSARRATPDEHGVLHERLRDVHGANHHELQPEIEGLHEHGAGGGGRARGFVGGERTLRGLLKITFQRCFSV